MTKKWTSVLLACTVFIGIQTSQAQNKLTLSDCRSLALENSKQIHITQEKIRAANYSKKAAFTTYLPSISASGTYLRNQKEMSILNKEQKNEIKNFAPSTKDRVYELADIIGTELPGAKKLIQNLGDDAFTELTKFSDALLEGVRTDTRNVFGGAITLTQPLYTGGKIRAYNRITKYAEELAKQAHNSQVEELILSVDQAYWQIVSLVNKEKLAFAYLELLNKLDEDIQHLIAEGMATKADGLSIRVKVNEAEMNLTKVKDGLTLSRMLLCQICGINLHQTINLADEQVDDLAVAAVYTDFDLAQAYQKRPEVKSLILATQIYDQKIRLTRSEYLPNIALIGNYLITNPSFYNGFENKFRGMFNFGVAVKIPIWNWGQGIYKTKAARAEAQIAKFQLDDAKEKIELQINQSAFKVNEASKRLIMASKNMEQADENLSYATYGFQEGVIPVSNVLEAHTAWLSAQADKIDAQIEVKLSEIYFKKALGTLSE